MGFVERLAHCPPLKRNALGHERKVVDDPRVPQDSVAAYFDSVASVYDEVLPFFASFAHEAAPSLDLAAGTRLLDLGAGRGAITRVALERGVHVTAVDAAPAMVDLLRHDHPEVDCRVMDAQRLEFAEDTFDAVVSAFVVHIVPDPQALITNAVHVVRPGGLVALIVPGRADEEPDEWQDRVQEIVREYRKFQPDGVGRHTGGDYESEEQIMVDAGLVAVSGRSLGIALAVPDGDTYWRWMNSHGAGTFAKALPEDLRAEMKERIVTLVDQSGGVLLRRSAALWIGHHP